MIPPSAYPPYARPIKAGAANPLTEKLVMVEDEVIAFKRRWWLAERRRTAARLAALRHGRRSDVCVIAGNGPGLLDTDWDALAHADVFGSNYAASLPELRGRLKYLSVVNAWVIAQSPESFVGSHCTVFAPFWLSCWLPEAADPILLNGVGSAGFETRVERAISCRSTVSYFNLQLAYALGYRKALLIGFDHRYLQPALPEGALIRQEQADPNHFSPDYFKGKLWQAADPERMEFVYALAKLAYERDGREIVNCSSSSALYVFRRGELRTEVDAKPNGPGLRPDITPGTGWHLRLEAAMALLSRRDAAVVTLLGLAIVATRTSYLSTLLYGWLGSFWGELVAFAGSAASVVLLVAFVLLRREHAANAQMELTAELLAAQARKLAAAARDPSDEPS